MLRESPAKLFGNLEAVGLGALRVVGAEVDVGESPAVGVSHLRAQAVDVVVVAAHGDDARTIDAGAGDLAELEIVGDEDDSTTDPSRAACEATLPARFPVDAHEKTEKPNSTARVAAIDTTRSL